MNSVAGLQDVRSITSRGSAEVDLSFDWSVDMVLTLQQKVNFSELLTHSERGLLPTAQIETNRLDFASFPILGYSLTSSKVSQADLWELATYTIKPRVNRLNGVASVLIQGRGAAGIPNHAGHCRKMLRAHVARCKIFSTRSITLI